MQHLWRFILKIKNQILYFFLLIIILEFSELNNNIANNTVEISIAGTELISPFSKNKYAYSEIVLYFGDADNIKSSYRILYHSDEGIVVNYKNKNYKLPLYKLRLHLDPVSETRIKYSDLQKKTNLNEFEKVLIKEFKQNDVNEILVSEFGLFIGRKYFAKVSEESYFLPPEHGEEPAEKFNDVLLISNQDFSNKIERTPRYSRWMY